MDDLLPGVLNHDKIYAETYNVLLLGQTGCGKSTFINSFLNYMKHNDFQRLRKTQKFKQYIENVQTIKDNFGLY